MAKYLVKNGYRVTIFGASTIPNTDINLIKDNRKYIYNDYDGFRIVNIKSPSYKGNGLSRKINLLLYPYRLWKYSSKYSKECKDRPDIIINDLSVMAMSFPFKIARRYKVPVISEVRDLWPESLVAYGYLKAGTPLAWFLYHMEKNMYKKSDRVVFSMEGGYDYITERGLTDIVPKSKAYVINNGLDLEAFNYNKDKYVVVDDDLSDDSRFKVIYTGAIRRVNNLGLLLDVAKEIKDERVIFLIWGDGNELEYLKKRVIEEKISNVIFKGNVEKKYVPSIVSRADLNIAHNTPSDIFRFGISFNKLFDYFASGRPVLCDFPCPYNPAINNSAGLDVADPTSGNISDAIERFVNMPQEQYDRYCKNALLAAEKYDFKELTKKLIKVIEELP
ncbi:MAG: glycosyltransferase family 4 protein [Saccharofermentans sp.]|nr:glycosyltransferase family 4 protein [Saccharofermentans sp.]